MFTLKTDLKEFLESATQTEIEGYLAECKEQDNTIRTQISTIKANVERLEIKKASERFKMFNVGDKVRLSYVVRTWRGEDREDVMVGHFGEIGRARESCYMRDGVYLNIAIPKKDGSMGKRYRSILVKDVKLIDFM